LCCGVLQEYRPAKLDFGVPHPDPVVETASLASVEPPDISYRLQLDDLVASGGLSALQLESIVYACQRHEQALPDGQRAGFFIGDGAGVGKGRTIAGARLPCDSLEQIQCSSTAR
jgi:P-loop containing NTP hydrolase pore-1